MAILGGIRHHQVYGWTESLEIDDDSASESTKTPGCLPECGTGSYGVRTPTNYYPPRRFARDTSLNATLTRGASVSISDVVSRPEQILRPSTRAVSSMAEQWTFNPLVLGSSPRRPTILGI